MGKALHHSVEVVLRTRGVGGRAGWRRAAKWVGWGGGVGGGSGEGDRGERVIVVLSRSVVVAFLATETNHRKPLPSNVLRDSPPFILSFFV